MQPPGCGGTWRRASSSAVWHRNAPSPVCTDREPPARSQPQAGARGGLAHRGERSRRRQQDAGPVSGLPRGLGLRRDAAQRCFQEGTRAL